MSRLGLDSMACSSVRPCVLCGAKVGESGLMGGCNGVQSMGERVDSMACSSLRPCFVCRGG